ncbi:rhomboid family intramembrane serine protease [Leptolyngbya sp. 15MV]|nr:rhomboid family intramembrane serine protease [Leptolyngbya sp. 15MV]
MNVAVYLLGLVLGTGAAQRAPGPLDQFVLLPGVSPWWTFLTYAFLHGGFLHLLGNMLTLWVFGPNIEDRFGRLGYVILYFAGAVAAGLVHSAVERSGVVGASGAIAAVTGAFMVLFPWTNVKVFCFFIVIGVFAVPALWFIGVRVAYDFILTGSGLSGRVATAAHLGGYGLGFGVALLLLWARIVPREPYDLFTTFRQAARRRQFHEAGFRRERQRQAQRSAISEAQRDQIAAARAEVSSAVADGDFPRAAAAYRRLLDRHGSDLGVALLSRRAHYELANGLFRLGDHSLAATAYDLFLRGYPADPETPEVRLMLGLLLTRYLNDPVRAKVELSAATERLPEGPQRDLARELLAELG